MEFGIFQSTEAAKSACMQSQGLGLVIVALQWED